MLRGGASPIFTMRRSLNFQTAASVRCDFMCFRPDSCLFWETGWCFKCAGSLNTYVLLCCVSSLLKDQRGNSGTWNRTVKYWREAWLIWGIQAGRIEVGSLDGFVKKKNKEEDTVCFCRAPLILPVAGGSHEWCVWCKCVSGCRREAQPSSRW